MFPKVTEEQYIAVMKENHVERMEDVRVREERL
jgi:hypothetical protein